MSWEDSIGEGWLSALSPRRPVGNDQAMVGLPEERQARSTSKYRLRLKDGDYRWIRARAFPRRNDAGDIVQWYGTLEDVHHHPGGPGQAAACGVLKTN